MILAIPYICAHIGRADLSTAFCSELTVSVLLHRSHVRRDFSVWVCGGGSRTHVKELRRLPRHAAMRHPASSFFVAFRRLGGFVASLSELRGSRFRTGCELAGARAFQSWSIGCACGIGLLPGRPLGESGDRVHDALLAQPQKWRTLTMRAPFLKRPRRQLQETRRLTLIEVRRSPLCFLHRRSVHGSPPR